MTNKLKISSLITLLTVATMSFSCSNTGNDSSKDTSSNSTSVSEDTNSTNSSSTINSELNFDTTKQVKIVFYHTMNQYLKEVLDFCLESEFNKLYPNIVVENVSAGGYDDVCDQLATSISAGNTVCDMAYCYPDHVALYNQANSLVTLDSMIYDGTYGLTNAQIADFVPAYWEEGKSFGDDLMYSLPLSKSSEVMYYDKTFFEEKGLDVPTHWFPTTANVDDDKTSMEYVCKKIKEIDPTCYPLGYDSEANWFITLCEQFKSPYTSATGNHYLFNNQTNKDFVSKLTDWYTKGYFTTKTIYGQYTSNLFKNQDKSSARCYMSIGSSAGAKNQVPDGNVFEVGIAGIPQVDAINNPKVISQGPNVCVFKNKDPQVEMACWLLLRYLTTSVLFQAQFSMTSGYTPVIKSVYENDTYLEFLDSEDGGDNITAASTNAARDQEDWFFTSPAFVGSSEARTQVGSLMASAVKKTMTIDQAFEYAISELSSN